MGVGARSKQYDLTDVDESEIEGDIAFLVVLDVPVKTLVVCAILATVKCKHNPEADIDEQKKLDVEK